MTHMTMNDGNVIRDRFGQRILPGDQVIYVSRGSTWVHAYKGYVKDITSMGVVVNVYEESSGWGPACKVKRTSKPVARRNIIVI